MCCEHTHKEEGITVFMLLPQREFICNTDSRFLGVKLCFIHLYRGITRETLTAIVAYVISVTVMCSSVHVEF